MRRTKNNELNDRNLKRIYRVNWMICGPLLLLFGWPYYTIASLVMGDLVSLIGALFFSVPFTLTILHGHITVALGSLHRNIFYSWQKRQKAFFRLAFHPVLFTTRLRLTMLMLSLVLLIGGLLL